MPSRNYYSILGIAPNASGDEIKWAYRRLAQRFHPDVSDDPDGECKFKAVGEAYRTLKGATTRLAYDRRARIEGAPGAFAWNTGLEQFWCPLSPWIYWAAFWA